MGFPNSARTVKPRELRPRTRARLGWAHRVLTRVRSHATLRDFAAVCFLAKLQGAISSRPSAASLVEVGAKFLGPTGMAENGQHHGLDQLPAIQTQRRNVLGQQRPGRTGTSGRAVEQRGAPRSRQAVVPGLGALLYELAQARADVVLVAGAHRQQEVPLEPRDLGHGPCRSLRAPRGRKLLRGRRLLRVLPALAASLVRGDHGDPTLQALAKREDPAARKAH
mmetsp:Transcript_73343/g.203528  ORF Transcript_73343/g.203528 Transcript_73343/m.203528 type:complete len:223 (-) Transcript_73343:1312-1980(-)